LGWLKCKNTTQRSLCVRVFHFLSLVSLYRACVFSIHNEQHLITDPWFSRNMQHSAPHLPPPSSPHSKRRRMLREARRASPHQARCCRHLRQPHRGAEPGLRRARLPVGRRGQRETRRHIGPALRNRCSLPGTAKVLFFFNFHGFCLCFKSWVVRKVDGISVCVCVWVSVLVAVLC